MSDFKALFKSAQAQRGIAGKPGAKQAKLRRLAEQESAAAVAGAHQQQQQQQQQLPSGVQRTAKAGPRGGLTVDAAAAHRLPPDFFESQPRKQGTTGTTETGHVGPTAAGQTVVSDAAVPSKSAAAAAATPAPPAAAPAAATAAVPAGFFDDRAADAKARGVLVPNKADKEAAFAAFNAEITTTLAEVAAEEEEDLAVAAEEREEREEFEQFLRQERIKRLKRRREAAAFDGPGAGEGDEDEEEVAAAGSGVVVVGPGPVPKAMSEAVAKGLPQAKRRRVIDSLAALEGSEDDEEEGEGEDDSLLDWRRKAV